MWGDSTNANVTSAMTDTFLIRASNGITVPVNAGGAKSVSVGERYRDNAINAWAKVAGNGTVEAEYGVATVTNPEAGAYFIGLDPVFQNASTLVAMAVAEVDARPAGAAAARLVTVQQVTVNGFAVYITDGGFAAVNNDFVFMVTGR